MTNLPDGPHGRGLPSVTRRAVVAAAPLLPFAAAPAALGAPAAAETPVLRLFRQWQALETAINDNTDGTDWTDARLFAACRDLHALELRIAAEPVTGAADLAAKVVAFTDHGLLFPEALTRALVAECEAILAGGAA